MMIYAICLVVGLTFTVVSVLAGHFFGGHDAHVAGSGGHAEAGADASDMPGISVFSPTVMAAFVTAFGGFGLIFTQFPKTSSPVVSAPLSLLGGVAVAGALLMFLRAVFSHTQSSSESHVANLIGAEANVITPIPENGVGEIAYVVGGTRYTAPARAENNASVANGETVKITRIAGTQFYVQATN
jgi:membrane protein implicated in regulation of membrane protease activity